MPGRTRPVNGGRSPRPRCRVARAAARPRAPPARPRAGPKAPLRGALVLGAPRRGGARQRAAHRARRGAPGAPTSIRRRAERRSARARPSGSRSTTPTRADLAAKAERRSRRSRSASPAVAGAARPRHLPRQRPAPARSRSSTPARARSTSNMLAELRDARAGRRRRRSTRPTDHGAAARGPAARRTSCSPTRRIPTRWRGPRRSCAAPRSPSRRCSPSTSRSPACSASTASRPTWSWATRLGEYGALVAAGALSFPAALEAVSARGREMASLRVEDHGAMAAVFGAAGGGRGDRRGDRRLRRRSPTSTRPTRWCIGGATEAVERGGRGGPASAGISAIPLPVSHALPHRDRGAGERAAARDAASGWACEPPELPIVANVTASSIPIGDRRREQMLDMLGRQVASPVQFVKGLRTLYDAGARVFVEVGPKQALQGFAADVLGDDAVVSLATNHPKLGDVAAVQPGAVRAVGRRPGRRGRRSGRARGGAAACRRDGAAAVPRRRRRHARRRRGPTPASSSPSAEPVAAGDGDGAARPSRWSSPARRSGLPGRRADVRRRQRRAPAQRRAGHRRDPERGCATRSLDKHITRLVKSEDGGARSRRSTASTDVIKLAGARRRVRPRRGVRHRRRAGRGARARDPAGDRRGHRRAARRRHPARAALQDDDEGHASSRTAGRCPTSCATTPASSSPPPSPASRRWPTRSTRYTTDRMRRERLAALESLRARMLDHEGTDPIVLDEVERRIHDLERTLEQEPLHVRPPLPVPRPVDGPLAVRRADRRPWAEHPGQLGLREHHAGRRAGRGLDPRRPLPAGVIVAADDVTSDTLLGLDRAPASSPRAPRPPTRSSRTRRFRSTSAATA